MMYDIGLILEGGGMRGTYTTGVLDFFMDRGIYFREIYGVSAGACHACSYVSKQRGRAFEIFEKYLNDERYCSFKSLRKTGNFFGAEMVYDLIPNQYVPFDYEKAAAYEGNLFSVVTNCRTGAPTYFKIEDFHRDMDKIRASASLPLLSKNVTIDGQDYLDGGISDSIPIAESIRAGNRKNVLILTREKGYRKEKSKVNHLVSRVYRKSAPGLVQAQKSRHIHYNDALALAEHQEALGQAFIIRPSVKPEVGRLEKNIAKLKDLYDLGYSDAQIYFDDLLKFLSGCSPDA